MTRVVLVTGVSDPLAARVADTLCDDPDVARVVGVDSAPPPEDLSRVEFVRVGLHDESVGQAVRDSGADTVLHLGLDAAPRTNRPRTRENNVLGAMRVLSACQRSADVRRLVVRASAALDADDTAEVERHTRGLVRRRPDLSVAVLRFANLIGPSVDTPLTRYLGSRLVPTVMGHDPRVRFLHEDDGVEVLVRTALGEQTGFYDIAADGDIPLSQCLRWAGRQRLPVPVRGLRVLRNVARHRGIDYACQSGRDLVSDHGTALAIDSARLERELRWSPSYTSLEAFASFVVDGGGSASSDRPGRRAGARLRPAHVAALLRASFTR